MLTFQEDSSKALETFLECKAGQRSFTSSKVLHLSLRDKERICNCKLSKRKPSRKKEERVFLLFWHQGTNLFFEVYIYSCIFWEASLLPQMIKNLPAMQETWVRSLSREDPLEQETATHASILVWEIPQTEEPGRPESPWSRRETDMTEQLIILLHFLSIASSRLFPRRIKNNMLPNY